MDSNPWESQARECQQWRIRDRSVGTAISTNYHLAMTLKSHNYTLEVCVFNRELMMVERWLLLNRRLSAERLNETQKTCVFDSGFCETTLWSRIKRSIMLC